MIEALHELRDLLESIENDDIDFNQAAMDAAISIVESLILQHEPPLPSPAMGLCYSVPTPYSPASAPPKPKPRPESQRPSLSNRKRKVAA